LEAVNLLKNYGFALIETLLDTPPALTYHHFVQTFSISKLTSEAVRRGARNKEDGVREFQLRDYLPILLMFIVAGGFAVSQIVLSQLVGQRKSTRTKLMPYECGKDPVGSARERFSVKFYLIAMIFILFDIELIFLMPWAVVFKQLASQGAQLRNVVFFEMLTFIALVFVGYVYVWKKGLFDWGESARREAHAEARALEIKEGRKGELNRGDLSRAA
jgi:NADH-quinone oxidoreductase subunit A